MAIFISHPSLARGRCIWAQEPSGWCQGWDQNISVMLFISYMYILNQRFLSKIQIKFQTIDIIYYKEPMYLRFSFRVFKTRLYSFYMRLVQKSCRHLLTTRGVQCSIEWVCRLGWSTTGIIYNFKVSTKNLVTWAAS